MPPKHIHLIRHAQSEHNARALLVPDEEVLRRDPGLRDAPLSARGHAQAQALAAEISALPQIELVVTTPLTRAIQTMLAAFANHPALRLVEPLHRECLDAYCDIGRAPAALAADFPLLRFDHLPDPWWHTGATATDPAAPPFAREDHASLDHRIRAFRAWLVARPEREIAVIGHSSFLRRMTGHDFANAQRIVLPL